MNNIVYDELQQKAIDLCCDPENRIVAITGEAGTGKTTIIKEVYRRLQKEITLYNKDGSIKSVTNDCVVVAPTGKAAKRIQEITGIPAITIHRLLEYPMPGEIDETTGKPLSPNLPKKDKFNPIDAHIVICDEYAMVNRELHSNLIYALPKGGMIRMFGDCNQLEPIEDGSLIKKEKKESPFQIALKKFPSVVLKQIHRQTEQSNIIKNAHLINLGIFPKKAEDFMIKFTSQIDQPADLILDIINKDKDFYTYKKQILSPTKQRWVGTEKLNNLIQTARFNDTLLGCPIERYPWCKCPLSLFEGDKVIITKNNYDLGIFNGETGIVTKCYQYGDIVVDFGDRIVNIPTEISSFYNGKWYIINPQKDIDLAYVITTHKAQGSEYEEIVYVLDKAVIFNQSRKNLYTAVTRAKKKVTIITDQRSLTYSLSASTGLYNR